MPKTNENMKISKGQKLVNVFFHETVSLRDFLRINRAQKQFISTFIALRISFKDFLIHEF